MSGTCARYQGGRSSRIWVTQSSCSMRKPAAGHWLEPMRGPVVRSRSQRIWERDRISIGRQRTSPRSTRIRSSETIELWWRCDGGQECHEHDKNDGARRLHQIPSPKPRTQSGCLLASVISQSRRLFFRASPVSAYSGSGLVIQRLARFQDLPNRRTARRMVSSLTRRPVSSWRALSSARSSRGHRLVGWPKSRGLRWARAWSCSSPASSKLRWLHPALHIIQREIALGRE
jgi:hypothetical protein